MNDATIPATLRNDVERELEPGERIEWMGMPQRSLYSPVLIYAFLSGMFFLTLALLWVGALVWGVMNMNGGPGVFLVLPLCGLPFALIGVAMVVAPFWVVRCARKTVYAITNRRVISIEGGWSTTVQIHPLSQVTNIFRRDRANGTGNVIFSCGVTKDANDHEIFETCGFWRIAKASEVEQRLKALVERSV